MKNVFELIIRKKISYYDIVIFIFHTTFFDNIKIRYFTFLYIFWNWGAEIFENLHEIKKFENHRCSGTKYNSLIFVH